MVSKRKKGSANLNDFLAGLNSTNDIPSDSTNDKSAGIIDDITTDKTKDINNDVSSDITNFKTVDVTSDVTNAITHDITMNADFVTDLVSKYISFYVNEQAKKQVSSKFQKMRYTDKHIRRTFYFRRDLVKDLEKINKMTGMDLSAIVNMSLDIFISILKEKRQIFFEKD